MRYTIKAHPTRYRGVQFRSRLEARWAAFLDLADMQWKYEPIDLRGWTPDFLVTLPICRLRGKECSHVNQLLVEVKPLDKIDFSSKAYEFRRADWMQDFRLLSYDQIPALFGLDPSVTFWSSMSCNGDSGGHTNFENNCRTRGLLDRSYLWDEAGNLTQWRP